MSRPVVARFEIRWLLACHLLLLLIVACSDRDHVVWRPPSAAFIDHDLDGDHWVSREEWESRYGTSASTKVVIEFDRHDCDSDGRLSWQEFHTLERSRSQCVASSLEKWRRSGGVTAEAVDEGVVITDKDLRLARVSLSRDRRKLVVAKFHEHYAEQAWPAGTPYLHAVTCGEAEWIEVPEVSQDFKRLSRFAVLTQGWRPAVRCSLANRSARTLTYLQLRVVTVAGGTRMEEVHGKTLWVPPGESRAVWIFPSPTRPVTAVNVLDVRTTRD